MWLFVTFCFGHLELISWLIAPCFYDCQSYHSLPVPPWNAYALGYQANTPANEGGYQIGANKENYNSNKEIATQVCMTKIACCNINNLLTFFDGTF